MFNVPGSVKIFVGLEPVDLRRGFDGLSGLVQQTLQQDPLSGHLFLFRNRRRDRLKILFWDGVVMRFSTSGWLAGRSSFPGRRIRSRRPWRSAAANCRCCWTASNCKAVAAGRGTLGLRPSPDLLAQWACSGRLLPIS
jgi:hypothetical protein